MQRSRDAEHPQARAEPERRGGIVYSYFDDVAAKTIHRGEAPWAAIVRRIENVESVASKDACGLIKLAQFGDKRSRLDSLRNNANVLKVSGFEGDYDGEQVSPEEAIQRLEKHGIRAVVYTSPSHTEEKPRWRVMGPLSRPHEPDDRRPILARVNGALGGILAAESFTLSQSYYIGRIEGMTYKTLHTFDDPEDGTCVDQLDALDEIAVYPTTTGSTQAAHDADEPADEPVTVAAETLRDLRSALCAIPSDDRGTWIRIGHALKPLGDAGRALWLEWSQTSSKYEAGDAGRVWQSFMPASTDYRAAFAEAQRHGWQNTRTKPNGAAMPPMTRGESALELLARDMPRLTHINKPWLPEGLTLLAGRPKLGKTTLMRQMAAAVGEGGELFGEPCEPCTSVFLQLEEGDRLNREKIERAALATAAMRSIFFFYEWPRGEQGAHRLDAYLTQFPDVRAVFIDSLTKFRSVPDRNLQAFIADYDAVAHLHAVSKRHPGCVFVVAHHTRKAKSEDPIDDISGTYGLTAACDTYWVMRKHNEGVELHVGGRLWNRDESTYGLVRGDQRWTLTAAFDGLTATQEDTLRIVRECGSIKPSALGKLLNISTQSAYERLKTLQGIGRLRYVRGGHGVYECT